MSTEEKSRLFSANEVRKSDKQTLDEVMGHEDWTFGIPGKEIAVPVTLFSDFSERLFTKHPNPTIRVTMEMTRNGVSIYMESNFNNYLDLCRFFGISPDDKVWKLVDLWRENPL